MSHFFCVFIYRGPFAQAPHVTKTYAKKTTEKVCCVQAPKSLGVVSVTFEKVFVSQESKGQQPGVGPRRQPLK